VKPHPLRLLVLGVLCGLLSLSPHASPDQANTSGQAATASLSGRVVDGDTGQPVANAQVVLRGASDRGSPGILTGPNGTFEFPALEPGLFSLTVTADGYLRGIPGALTPWDRGRSISATAGQQVSGEVIRLWRRSSISGTVRDEFGDPIVQAVVQPLRVDYVGGEKTWEIARDTGAVANFVTDDRGAYRITGLSPGEYVVMVRGDPAQQGYRTGFSGSARSVRQAQSVLLHSGEDRTGIDFQIGHAEGPGKVAVSGRLAAPVSVGTSATVRLIPAEFTDEVAGLGELTGAVQSDGAFSFPSVAPGSYRLQAWQFPETGTPARVMRVSGLPVVLRPPRKAGQPAEPAPAAPTWVGEMPVTADKALRDLQVQLRPGGRISGRIVLDGAAMPPLFQQLTNITVLVEPAYERWLGVIPTGRVESDGSFVTAGLPPGRYTLRFDWREPDVVDGGPWRFVSLAAGSVPLTGRAIGVEASDVDVTVTFANRVPGIVGIVRGDTETVQQARVILFARDPQLRGYGLTAVPSCVNYIVPDGAGRFVARGFRHCDYLAAAVLRPPRLWMDPEYLTSLVPRATPVTFPVEGDATVELVVKR
jgi:hypothetical protein